MRLGAGRKGWDAGAPWSEPEGAGLDWPRVEARLRLLQPGGTQGPRRRAVPFVERPDERHCMHLALQHLRLVICDARPGPGVCVRIAGLCKWQIGSVA